VFRRARDRSQACGRWGALEVHRVVKRARGVGLRSRPTGGVLAPVSRPNGPAEPAGGHAARSRQVHVRGPPRGGQVGNVRV